MGGTDEEGGDEDEEYSVDGSVLTPFVKSSPVQLSSVNLNDLTSSNNKNENDKYPEEYDTKDTKDDYSKDTKNTDDDDYSKDTKDTKYTPIVNRNDRTTDELAEDVEEDNEESHGMLNDTFGQDDFAVLFVVFVIIALSLAMGIFIGGIWGRKKEMEFEKVNQYDYV